MAPRGQLSSRIRRDVADKGLRGWLESPEIPGPLAYGSLPAVWLLRGTGQAASFVLICASTFKFGRY